MEGTKVDECGERINCLQTYLTSSVSYMILWINNTNEM